MSYVPYQHWVPHLNIDSNATTATWPTLPRSGIDDDFDGVADDGMAGGWRVTPWDGTADEDTDGPWYVNGVLVTGCDDNDNDGRDDHTGAGPCDDDDTNNDGRDDGGDEDGDVDVDGGTATQLSWPEVWQSVRVSWVALNLYAKAFCGPANGGANNTCRNTIYNSLANTDRKAPIEVVVAHVARPLPRFMSATEVAEMNEQLQQSCTQAQNNGVEIYGIAFEAPPEGEEQIFDCASSEFHFYYAGSAGQTYASDGRETTIEEAFEAIAAQINALRLTE